jgi:hypothetical protein
VRAEWLRVGASGREWARVGGQGTKKWGQWARECAPYLVGCLFALETDLQTYCKILIGLPFYRAPLLAAANSQHAATPTPTPNTAPRANPERRRDISSCKDELEALNI